MAGEPGAGIDRGCDLGTLLDARRGERNELDAPVSACGASRQATLFKLIGKGPLGQLDGAAVYEQALGHIFGLTRSIGIVKQWIDGPDTLTWFDLHHTHGPTPLPVANWVRVEGGLITRVRIAFDARQILP